MALGDARSIMPRASVRMGPPRWGVARPGF
jgi:hypothetical protein